MATSPALSAAETRAAEALLARVWDPGTSVHGAEPIWDRSHVIRLHLGADRSVVMKKRAGNDSFGVELAALEYLNGMPEPVAPRLVGADADAGILLMEDLADGRSWPGSLAGRLAADRRPFTRASGPCFLCRGAGIHARVAAGLHEQLSARWPEAVIADYPALAGPSSARVQIPDFWQPEV